jgi:hypothetical protein
MALLAVAILVPAAGIRRLGGNPIMPHQRLILGRVLLGMPFLVDGQGHAVGAMTLGHTVQFPEGILRPFAQAGEALREAHRHVLPVRVGQHEVVQKVRKRLPMDGHAQAVHVREVRRAQSARLMHLAEEHFLGRPVLGTPPAHAPFDGPPLPLPVLARVFPLQPLHQRLGL